MSRRRRTLRPEERALWRKVADTAAPLHPHPPPPKADPAPLPPRQEQAPRSEAPGPRSPFRIGEAAGTRHDLPDALSDRLAREALRMDRKAHARMKRGKLGPEGRLDLHGMTLAEAHPRLVEFILSAQARGKRLVLVITGKGRAREDEGPIPVRRGVLKHQVPQWLRGPGLAHAVLQVAEAHHSHGGSGAYYVYLRRNR